MGSTTLLPLSSHNCCPKNVGLALKPTALRSGRGAIRFAGIRAAGKKKQSGTEDEDEGEVKISKQSLLNSIADALDLSQTRSSQDARLIEEAKEATKSGGKMNMEQYGALRRKIGGTYKDFFKTYVEDEEQKLEDTQNSIRNHKEASQIKAMEIVTIEIEDEDKEEGYTSRQQGDEDSTSREEDITLRDDEATSSSDNNLKDSMWKKVGWTKHARYVRETPKENRGRSTSSEDTYMCHA